MSNLENHVPALELSKRLKELGVLHNELFWWVKPEYLNSDYIVVVNQNKTDLLCLENGVPESYSNYDGDYDSGIKDSVPAFLASELWELLPDSIEDNMHSNHPLYKTLVAKENYVIYKDITNFGVEIRDSEGGSLPNALAETLIWCIENKYVNLEGNP